MVAECFEDGAAGGEAVGDPIGLTVTLQRCPSFASANVDFGSRIGHPLELSDELSGPGFECGLLEQAEHSVVERDGRSVTCLDSGLVRFEEAADRCDLVGSGFGSHIELSLTVGDGRAGGSVAENEVEGQHEFDFGLEALAIHLPGLFDALEALIRGPKQQGAPSGTLRAPVVIGWGSKDRVTPPRQAQRALERFPDAVLHWFSECGHFPHWDRPGETVQLILDSTGPR